MSILGIDVGTSGCKAAAFNLDGKSIAEAHREYPALYPAEGLAELDSRLVWNSVKEVIASVAAQTKDDPITALAASSLGESVVPVTNDREILGNSLLFADSRGREYKDILLSQIDPIELYEINPNIPGPNYTIAKLMWRKKHAPELYAKADQFILWDTFVGFMLGGKPCVCLSNADRTMLFDIRREEWSEKILKAVGLDAEKLPPALPSGEIIGTVSNAMADELGLPKGVKIVIGGHDQCCNALGAGIIEPGSAVDGIGTFECITPVYGKIPPAEQMLKHGLNVEHHVLEGMYVSFIYNQAGCLIRWFRDTFASEARSDPKIFDKLNCEIPANPTNLFILPYFEPTGPPDYLDDASGVIAGLKTSTTRGEIFKAFMENITYHLAAGAEVLTDLGIDTSRFIATGGGAKSDAWLQIKADIFGVPFIRSAHTECGLIGAAMLAGVGTGLFSDIAQASEVLTGRAETFYPNPARHEIYRQRIGKFKELAGTMTPFLQSLGTATTQRTTDGH